MISIHAPTRGATPPARCNRNFKRNFNPRSHEGSDKIAAMIVPYHRDFNPRSHEGSDDRSICPLDKLRYFNPRSHEGSDNKPRVTKFWLQKFQSTLPRGERRKGASAARPPKNFNPRSHEGSDVFETRTCDKMEISIHAPTRGATSCADIYHR